MLNNGFQRARHHQDCPFPWGIWTPMYYVVPWAHPSHHPERHLDRFRHFCRAYKRDRYSTRLIFFPPSRSPRLVQNQLKMRHDIRGEKEHFIMWPCWPTTSNFKPEIKVNQYANFPSQGSSNSKPILEKHTHTWLTAWLRFLSSCQKIGWEKRVQSKLFCIKWDVKP